MVSERGKHHIWGWFFAIAFVLVVLAFISGASRPTESELYRLIHIAFTLITAIVAFGLGIQFLKIFWKHDHASYFFLFCALSSLAFFWIARAFATPVGHAGNQVLFDAAELLGHIVAAFFVAMALFALIKQKPFISEKSVVGIFLGSYFLGACLMWFISQYSYYINIDFGNKTLVSIVNAIVYIIFGLSGWIFTRYSMQQKYARLDLIGIGLILAATSFIFRILSDPWTFGWWIYHLLFLLSIAVAFFSIRMTDRKASRKKAQTDEYLA